jgi:hypothetical protein
MEYKLFLFGNPELFAMIEVFYRPLKEGEVFNFNGKRYKILKLVVHSRAIEYDADGRKKYLDENKGREFMPEIYVTEIPEF